MQGRKRADRRNRRRRPHRANDEPIVIAARRPPVRRPEPLSATAAASVSPGEPGLEQDSALTLARGQKEAGSNAPKMPALQPEPRRARIVLPSGPELDPRATERQRLFDKLMNSEGRGAVTRAANEFQQAGFTFPEEQAVQLQLLEHFDEGTAHDAIVALERILMREHLEKRPVLEHRLRRLEELAEDASTREAAANLLRALR